MGTQPHLGLRGFGYCDRCRVLHDTSRIGHFRPGSSRSRIQAGFLVVRNLHSALWQHPLFRCAHFVGSRLWVQVLVKAATAVASIGTAIVLWQLLPQALALPSSAQLQAANVAFAAKRGALP